MAHRVDAWTASGIAAGWLAGTEHPRTVLETGGELALERVTWQPLPGLVATPLDRVTLAVDDVLVAIDDDDVALPVHASWHVVALEVGPYLVTGELPTMPGFDPGRALTRPTGEFVLLRDVRLGIRDRPELGTVEAGHGLVNRYGVERVEADLMLGFYFPGAELPDLEPAVAPAPAVAATPTPEPPSEESPAALA